MLKTLCMLDAASGREDAVRDFLGQTDSFSEFCAHFGMPNAAQVNILEIGSGLHFFTGSKLTPASHNTPNTLSSLRTKSL